MSQKMASTSYISIEPSLIKSTKQLIWGAMLKSDVFSRWSQGFVFSDAVPTALVQMEGGPCAVLAPVQAFIIKCALFGECSPHIASLTQVSSDKATKLLLEALVEILIHLNSTEYVLVGRSKQMQSDAAASASVEMEETNQDETSRPVDQESEGDSVSQLTSCNEQNVLGGCEEEDFHSNLQCYRCSTESDLRAAVSLALPSWQSSYGVLLYLYSVLLTKGIHQIKSEVEDPSEPLIDGTYGHGSQSLINLFLTSQATSNVWDHDKEISGLKLRGVQQQSTIGFLTLLEHMRYCEVGWFLKNPKFPIWLLGSETHLTILFSTVENLVVRDSPEMNAKHVFSQFDPEGNGFISSVLLGDIMQALDFVAEEEYVEIMKNKLDSEGLGIITRTSFMEEFFPNQSCEQPQSFTLFHYNGLRQSSRDGQVAYTECKAVLAEEIDTQFITDTSPIKLCLQTKWPSIELTWQKEVPPSLN